MVLGVENENCVQSSWQHLERLPVISFQKFDDITGWEIIISQNFSRYSLKSSFYWEWVMFWTSINIFYLRD